MEDTWAARDLPVLDAVVSLLDEGAVAGIEPEGSDIAERTELSLDDVAAALQALNGEFLELGTPMGGPGSGSSAASPARRDARLASGLPGKA